MNAAEIIDILGLQPHPTEGGYYRETYRSYCPASSQAPGRSISTAIYYLITENTFSAMHRLRSDEVFHFYSGDPVEMQQLYPDGSHDVILIGSDIAAGQSPQVVVNKLTWQGCRLVRGGRWALMGTTVAPGFDPDDYEHGDRDTLVREYPQCAAMIEALTTRGGD